MTTVLITGANRGIGFELAKLYAQRGDTICACCREPEKAERLRTLAKSYSVSMFSLDVGSDRSVSDLSRQLSNAAIDILINNAGIIGQPVERQTAANMDFALWEDLLKINTLGPARVLQALLPQLKRAKHPKVMNVTSDLGALANDN